MRVITNHSHRNHTNGVWDELARCICVIDKINWDETSVAIMLCSVCWRHERPIVDDNNANGVDLFVLIDNYQFCALVQNVVCPLPTIILSWKRGKQQQKHSRLLKVNVFVLFFKWQCYFITIWCFNDLWFLTLTTNYKTYWIKTKQTNQKSVLT